MAVFFVVSDVHSFYDEMMAALKEKKFNINNDNHVFVSCGDLLDRGPQSKECLRFVNDLPSSRKILIKGNHEWLMKEAIDRKYFLSHDRSNGTIRTVAQVTGLPEDSWDSFQMLSKMEFNEDWVKYFYSCINYYENEKYIFVHGWIPCLKYEEGIDLFGDYIYSYNPVPDWKVGNWEKATWMNGMDCWKKNIRVHDKTIICGHYHSSWGHSRLHHKGKEYPDSLTDFTDWNYTAFKDRGIINLDACTVISKYINCIKLINQEWSN